MAGHRLRYCHIGFPRCCQSNCTSTCEAQACVVIINQVNLHLEATTGHPFVKHLTSPRVSGHNGSHLLVEGVATTACATCYSHLGSSGAPTTTTSSCRTLWMQTKQIIKKISIRAQAPGLLFMVD